MARPPMRLALPCLAPPCLALPRVALPCLALVAACYDPSLSACRVACGTGTGSCPAGLVCADDGFCHGSLDEPRCDGADAATPDSPRADGAAPPADAPAPSCPGNLVENPAFEGIGHPWIGADATLTVVEGGRTGRALRVCLAEGQDDFGADLYLGPPSLGDAIQLAGWLRVESGTGAPAPCAVQITGQASDGGNMEQATTPGTIGATWKQLGATLVVGVQSARVELEFECDAVSEDVCFLLDDVCARREP